MNMKGTMWMIMLIFLTSTSWSCLSYKVISEQVRTESEPGVSFKTLVQETERYKGKTVILGGYIVETKNLEGNSAMTVLETPLILGEKPGPRARSEGGFILSYKGYLEPEVYEKDRKVTVAGKVIGRVLEEAGNCPSPCLKLEYRQIHLWPMYEDTFDYDGSRYEDWGVGAPMDRVDY